MGRRQAGVLVLPEWECGEDTARAVRDGIDRDFSSLVHVVGRTRCTGCALPAADVRYVGQVVALRTGLSQQDAEKRVTET